MSRGAGYDVSKGIQSSLSSYHAAAKLNEAEDFPPNHDNYRYLERAHQQRLPPPLLATSSRPCQPPPRTWGYVGAPPVPAFSDDPYHQRDGQEDCSIEDPDRPVRCSHPPPPPPAANPSLQHSTVRSGFDLPKPPPSSSLPQNATTRGREAVMCSSSAGAAPRYLAGFGQYRLPPPATTALSRPPHAESCHHAGSSVCRSFPQLNTVGGFPDAVGANRALDVDPRHEAAEAAWQQPQQLPSQRPVNAINLPSSPIRKEHRPRNNRILSSKYGPFLPLFSS
jgi:hypothetical protein